MSEQPTAAPSQPAPPPTPGEIVEAAAPEWQRWLNRFCENWIFAFIVAMGVRHFCLEAFRIPTASMEPMLYGDPAVLQSDHVLVDKLISRFRGVHRWDVTVFQFPQPEVRDDSGNEVTAYDADGDRRDNLVTNPLSYRNFVKRAVILPGDDFFVANGDIFLKGEDGAFHISRKPPAVQEAVWQDIYRHDPASPYRPWAAASAGIAVQGDRLQLQLAANGSIAFTQPLRNLYLKPGQARVAPYLGEDENSVRASLDASQIVDVSMTSPEFTLRDGTKGNIWDLERWNVWRVTSADLDNASHSRRLNDQMREYVGDVRVLFDLAQLDGRAVLTIAEGRKQKLDLQLTVTGWQLDRDGEVVARGDGSPVGKPVSFANIDDQAVVVIGGAEVARVEVAACDPQAERTTIAWSGEGSASLAQLRVQRDLHYCANGFLTPVEQARTQYMQLTSELQSATDPDRRTVVAKALRDMRDVRAMMRGKRPEELTREEEYRPYGYSRETAIHVPDGAYLMLGDNSALSWDGRAWGWVPGLNLRGRVLAVVLWPWRWHVVR